jgi:hypothetical protein
VQLYIVHVLGSFAEYVPWELRKPLAATTHSGGLHRRLDTPLKQVVDFLLTEQAAGSL